MAASQSYVLLQKGEDPFHTRFEDLDGHTAFTVDRMSNTLVQLRREAPWAHKHQGIMGPGAAFFYFGPSGAPGYLVYGNAPSQPMATTLRRKRLSASQYFTSQSGRRLKWKQLPNQMMECVDGKQVLAIYETGHASRDYTALLTIRQAGLAVVTEILTTLMLSQMATLLQWQN
ncbi:hypothetical protein BC834DRAFT_926469 [Gloeopeniophorella convolvens]|nr:hypothetical protein BC834DRAFT_926469 [Gloeopeniophorella convolvens]